MANDNDTRRTGIEALSDLSDYRVARGNPDIRGWTVYGNDDREIGTVRDLLVDLDAMKARYMVVGLKHAFLAPERRVVLPIGRARLDEARDHVFVDQVSSTQLDTLRDYDPATFRAQERSLFGADYTQADYDDTRFWGGRRDLGAGERYVELHERQLDGGKNRVVEQDVALYDETKPKEPV
ncbi:MAG: PRC-barrel domain-containing protein [Myxococcota bacterium]